MEISEICVHFSEGPWSRKITLFTIKLCKELQKSELYLRFTIENWKELHYIHRKSDIYSKKIWGMSPIVASLSGSIPALHN